MDQVTKKHLDNLYSSDANSRYESFQYLIKLAYEPVDWALQKLVIDRLEKRYKECIAEKNCTLIRFDIIEVMKKIYDKTPDDLIKEKAIQLIATEEDEKYRKKYAGLWKDLVKKK